MKKAATILLLVGGIFAFVAALGLIIGGTVLAVFSSPNFTDLIVEALKEGTIHSSVPGTPEEVAAIVQATFLTVGIVLLVLSLLYIVSGVLAIIGRKAEKQGLTITNLVLAVLTCNLITLVGTILAVVDDEK